MSTTPEMPHPFARSGLAALSDLESPHWEELFALLEKEQTEFLAKGSEFRSPEYKWPRDPLHTWSRAWEYPYIYYHLTRWRRTWSGHDMPRVVDFGSGVTFFPFSVARLGCRVTCTDLDPICHQDLLRAIKLVAAGSGMVESRLSDGIALPFEDMELDALYSVSVLEHIPDPPQVVSELARVLKPGAPLFLTIDLDLRGDSEISVTNYRRLKAALFDRFEYLAVEQTIHPADVLHSSTGPFGVRPPAGLHLLRFHLRQASQQMLRGRKPLPVLPYHLAVGGFVMIRR